MSQPIVSQPRTNARSVLLTYFGVLALLSVAVQMTIALMGNAVDGRTQWVLAAPALVIFGMEFMPVDPLAGWRRTLSELRFGRLVAHVCAYLTVNLGFLAHGFVLIVTDNDAIRGDGGLTMDGGWFGVAVAMPLFWGLGLLVHLASSIGSRGYEHLDA